MDFSFAQFFRGIKKVFRGHSALGIDIGSSSIKIAELAQKGNEFHLTNYAKLETKNYLDHPNRALQTSSLRIVEKEVIALIRTLLGEMKTKSNRVFLNIPAFIAFVSSIEMPMLSPNETARSLQFQARQYIPLPPSEVSLDWKKIGEFKNQKGVLMQRLLLIGIPKELLARYRNIFKKLPVRLVGMELESIAAVRALGSVEDKTRMYIDIGAEYTNVMFADKGGWVSNGQIDYGGVYLTQSIARGLGITVSRAESLKRRRGLLGTGGEFELSTLLVPFLDVIIQEVRRLQRTHETRYGAKTEEVVLIGGSANLLGIEKYVNTQMGIPVVSPKPFEHIQIPPAIDDYKKELSREFSVAVGLAEKYFL